MKLEFSYLGNNYLTEKSHGERFGNVYIESNYMQQRVESSENTFFTTHLTKMRTQKLRKGEYYIVDDFRTIPYKKNRRWRSYRDRVPVVFTLNSKGEKPKRIKGLHQLSRCEFTIKKDVKQMFKDYGISLKVELISVDQKSDYFRVMMKIPESVEIDGFLRSVRSYDKELEKMIRAKIVEVENRTPLQEVKEALLDYVRREHEKVI